MSRVLLVHADPAIGAKIAAKLTGAGVPTRIATSGERAMERFIQEPADVIVIDYQLEGRDGVSTAEAIRWMPGGRRARVILTAEREPEQGELAELGRSVGAFATLVGPLDLQQLRAEVERAVAVHPREAETRALSTEHALLSVERARDDSGDDTTTPTQATPSGALTESLSSFSAAHPSSLDEETLEEPAPAAWQFRDREELAEGREVVALAAQTPDAGSAFFGSFDEVPFARLLGRVAERRSTGALICVHPPDERPTTEGTEPTKVVYFRAGVPVQVRSNLLAECLGHVLARQRRIGPATLRESVSAVQRGEGRQGEVLVRMGAIAPLELSEALAEQLRTKLFELFTWSRGTFRFAADRVPPDELIDLELGLAEIVYHGVRRTVPEERALTMLEPHREHFVIPHARRMVRFVGLPMAPSMRELIRQIDGSRRVDEILEATPESGEAARLLHAMDCLDAVRFEVAPLRPVALHGSDAVDGPDGLDSEVAARMAEAVAHAQEFEGRATIPDADSDEVHDSPDPSEGVASAALATSGDGADAIERVREAEAMEGDETTDRADLEKALQDASDAFYAPLETTLETPIEWEIDSTEGESSLGSDHEPSHDGEPSEHLASNEPFAPPLPASEDLCGDQPTSSAGPVLPFPDLDRSALVAVQGTDAAPSTSPLFPAAEAPDPLDQRAPQPPLDVRVDRLLRAERHFRRGQRALDRQRYDVAVEALSQAAELCPQEGKFVAYLAYAQHASVPNDAEILQTSLERAERACLHAYGVAGAHLMRARLLLAAGRSDDARRAFERVLQLTPDDEEALAALGRKPVTDR